MAGCGLRGATPPPVSPSAHTGDFPGRKRLEVKEEVKAPQDTGKREEGSKEG